MGRWGWRLFEADRDIDIANGILDTTGQPEEGWAWTPAQAVNQTDMLAPAEARAIYRTQEYATDLQNQIIPFLRQKYDTNNLGEQMLIACQAGGAQDRTYTTIIMGALIMRVGGKLSPKSVQRLRELVPQVNCNVRYTLPLFDEGFRSPGRAQFLAALDHYQAGVPRSFMAPSCFHCGQIESDIGHALPRCARCQVAWYCKRECQAAHWEDHKHSCVSPDRRRMLNV